MTTLQQVMMGQGVGRVLSCAGAVCSVAATVALLSMSPEIQPDTASYIAHSPERAPLYPYLLDLFRALFGEGLAAQIWLAHLQTAGLVAACAFFALRVGRALGLSLPLRHVLFLMLALPGLKFASVLLTESLGYTLIIAFWALLAEDVLIGRNHRTWLCILCGLGVLLRPQFLFLPVFLGTFLLVRLACRRDGASVLSLVLLAVIMAGAVTLRGAENKVRHGSFATASSGGIHLLSSLLYISVPADASALSDPVARGLFEQVQAEAEARQLTRRYWNASRAHFEDALVGLVFDVVRPELAARMPAGLNASERALREDQLAMSTALPLLAHMPGRYLELLSRKLYDGQPFYYALLVLGGALCFAHSLRTGSRPTLLLGLAAAHSCLSYGVILLVGSYALRYIFPAEAVYLTLTLAVGLRLCGPSDPGGSFGARGDA